MKVFIWENVSPVSNNWHADGSVVVIAESVEVARDEWVANPPRDYFDGPIGTDALDGPPDHEYELAGSYEPKVLVFPDAGCC